MVKKKPYLLSQVIVQKLQKRTKPEGLKSLLCSRRPFSTLLKNRSISRASLKNTMSDQKDQSPDSPTTQDSTGLPFKKRYFAETMSKNNGSDDGFVFPTNNDLNLYELQKQAYYDVLFAFKAESDAASIQRLLIMKQLMKELKISAQTHTTIYDKIKTDPLVKQLRKVVSESDEKVKQKVTAVKEGKFTAVKGKPLTLRVKISKEDILKFQEKLYIAPAKIQSGSLKALAKIQEEKAKLSYTPDDSPVGSWGQVSSESLVGQWVSIRMPREEIYNVFLIKEYDAQTEMHHLVNSQSLENLENPCDWIDLRHIPTEDIIWHEGHPGFPTRKCSLKPGETILYATRSAPKKRQIMEVGETSSGIPIIKLNKGKGIVSAKSSKVQ